MPDAPMPAVGRISLIVDGREMTFSEMAGIAAEVEPAEYLSGTGEANEPISGRFYGKPKPPTISLKRPAGRDPQLWEWHASVRAGQVALAAKDAELVIFSSDEKSVMKYWLENAWPTKIELTGLKAGGSELLVETVTLACESIRRDAP